MTDSGTPTTDHAHILCREDHTGCADRWQRPHCSECGQQLDETDSAYWTDYRNGEGE